MKCIPASKLGLITMRQAAEQRGVIPMTIWLWMKTGRLPVIVIPGKRPGYLIRQKDLDKVDTPKRGRPPAQPV